MDLNENTQQTHETISALMVIADEDNKQSNTTSSLDVIEMLTITQTVLTNNLRTLPFNTFKHDPFLNRYFEYTQKECIQAIDRVFSNAQSKHPCSVYNVFKSRVVPAILQNFKTVPDIATIEPYFENLIVLSTEKQYSLQEAFSYIIKTRKQHVTNHRLLTIERVVAKFNT